jgi:hypothetical protein
MPKRAKELTARHVASLKEDGCYAVGGVVGLYLNIRGGSRCWFLRIKIGNRRREFGLGSYPEVSLAVARDRTWARRRLMVGRSAVAIEMAVPQSVPRSASPPCTTRMTFESRAKAYIAAQAPGGSPASTRSNGSPRSRRTRFRSSENGTSPR